MISSWRRLWRWRWRNWRNIRWIRSLRGQLIRIITSSASKERDAESGNDYFEARYYSSAMGRFMSPDWSAKVEPVPYSKLDDPQTLNLYAYVGNNPLIRIDADGHYELNASGCGDNAKCQKKYDKAANKFEARREK